MRTLERTPERNAQHATKRHGYSLTPPAAAVDSGYATPPPLIQSKTTGTAHAPFQLAHINMDKPSPMEMELLTMWNTTNKFLIRLFNYKYLGRHGTNFRHALSMMRDGIKVQIPDEKRTSDVTPKGHVGFYVDTSASGDGHAVDFAKKSAYGSADIPGDEEYAVNANAAAKKALAAESAFASHVAEMQKSGRRGVVLQIWGPSTIQPKQRYDHQQPDEEVYKDGADQILVTIEKFI